MTLGTVAELLKNLPLRNLLRQEKKFRENVFPFWRRIPMVQVLKSVLFGTVYVNNVDRFCFFSRHASKFETIR